MKLGKLLSIGLLTAALSVTVPVNRAQAAVATTSLVGVLVSGILAGTGVMGAMPLSKAISERTGSTKKGSIVSTLASIALVGGAIALNESGELRFNELSAQDAAELSLNGDDVAAYNDEVHILNAIAFEMQNELGGQEYAGLSNEELTNASAELFNESYADTLSSGTIRVLGSITL